MAVSLNVAIKKTENVTVDQKTRSNYLLSEETHFKYKSIYKLKVKGWRKTQYANINKNKAGVGILISDRADFRARGVIKGIYVMIKVSILQDNVTILNVYMPNNGMPKYTRQKPTELQGIVDESTIIVGDFNTPLSKMDRSSRWKKLKKN